MNLAKVLKLIDELRKDYGFEDDKTEIMFIKNLCTMTVDTIMLSTIDKNGVYIQFSKKIRDDEDEI